MIFVTVGTQLPFDRLVRAVDDWAALHPTISVSAQINSGGHMPRNLRAVPELTPLQFVQHFAAARVVVAHAGMGTIISALETGKPLVVLPRLAALGEHRNDHQVGTATHFSRFSCIRVADSENNVGNLIDELLLGEEESVQLQSSPATSQELLDGIRRFLAG